MTTADAPKTKFLVRPTLDTKFHIDYDWWDRADRDLEVYLRSHLCAEHQEAYAEVDAAALVDNVDATTGEVTRVPGIQNVLITHCAQQPNYITKQTSLVNAVFRIFLASGNTPLSSRELGERLGRSPTMVMRTFSSPRVYKGIRPYQGD
ncbi:MAG: hypothetical protein GTO18_16620 [Anaerolineales bacterium]|nr:hypothetical protein [Anaerolineales bacterium]